MAETADGGGARWRVAITGASGLIGTALARSLQGDGHQVVPVVRRATGDPGEVVWDPVAGTIAAAGLEGVGAVVHLAGENVGERWTAERKRRIRESRIQGTGLLARTLASLAVPPAVLVSASAIGYYGDRGEERLDEESAPGSDWLAAVAREWEAAADPAERAAVRVVHPRFGVVLSAQGGALHRMLTPFRLGAGGTLGDGRQWMSWVSIDDVVGAIRFAIQTHSMRGAFNLTAPEPVTNEEFTHTLGRVLDRPAGLHVPAALLRLRFGEMADAALLTSQKVVPARLLSAGYRFRYPHLEDALRAALNLA